MELESFSVNREQSTRVSLRMDLDMDKASGKTNRVIPMMGSTRIIKKVVTESTSGQAKIIIQASISIIYDKVMEKCTGLQVLIIKVFGKKVFKKAKAFYLHTINL